MGWRAALQDFGELERITHVLSECTCVSFHLFLCPLPHTSRKELGCDGRRRSPHFVISLIFSGMGRKRRPEGGIGGAAENLPDRYSAEQLQNVRLRDPLFLILLTPLSRTRWRGVRLKLWLPCLALSTKWVPSLPSSVSIYSLFKEALRGNVRWSRRRAAR